MEAATALLSLIKGWDCRKFTAQMDWRDYAQSMRTLPRRGAQPGRMHSGLALAGRTEKTAHGFNSGDATPSRERVSADLPHAADHPRTDRRRAGGVVDEPDAGGDADAVG